MDMVFGWLGLSLLSVLCVAFYLCGTLAKRRELKHPPMKLPWLMSPQSWEDETINNSF